MNKISLYRGVWPGNVNRTAKYTIKLDKGEWRVKVQVELATGLFYYAVDKADSAEVIHLVNEVKTQVGTGEGGVFYLNEYGHLIVPVKIGEVDTHYFLAGKIQNREFKFEYEGEKLTNKPVGKNGKPLNQGDRWTGPRPGIPYVLAAGGNDIRLTLPEITDSDPPTVKRGVQRKVNLSKFIENCSLLDSIIKPILDVKGHSGGRFYVNEHGAIFAPLTSGDGDGVNYFYCGTIDESAWFPEPNIHH